MLVAWLSKHEDVDITMRWYAVPDMKFSQSEPPGSKRSLMGIAFYSNDSTIVRAHLPLIRLDRVTESKFMRCEALR